MRKILIPIVLVITIILVAFFVLYPSDKMQHITLSIERQNNIPVAFNAEVAATERQGKTGLMHRTSLANNAGMLFPIPPGEIVWMWMKDTEIPIDMIFIGMDNTITKIAAHNKPHDETPVQSDGLIRAVLEINDGMATKSGIAVGDKVDYDLK